MTQAKARPNVVECCGDTKLLESFKECNKLLELVSKGLSAYLESKRYVHACSAPILTD